MANFHSKYAHYMGAGFLCLSITAAVLSNTFIHLLGVKYPAMMVLFYKSFVGCVVLSLVFCRQWKKILIVQNVPVLLARTSIGIVGVFLWIRALQSIPIGPASILALTSSFFSAMGGYILLKEKRSWQKDTSLVLGFVGAFLIISPHISMHEWSYGLPILSAFCFGISATLTRYLSAQESEWSISFYLFFLMALCAMPMGAQLPSSMQDFLILCCIGALYAMSQILFVRAYKHAEASYLAPFKFVKPPVHIMIGYLFFKESIGYLDFLGFITIVFALKIVTFWSSRKKQQHY